MISLTNFWDALRVVVAAVFLFASLGKATSFGPTAHRLRVVVPLVLRAPVFLSKAVSASATAVLIVLEAGAGAMLLSPAAWAGAWLSLFLYLGFGVWTVLAIRRGQAPDCGCFGRLSRRAKEHSAGSPRRRGFASLAPRVLGLVSSVVLVIAAPQATPSLAGIVLAGGALVAFVVERALRAREAVVALAAANVGGSAESALTTPASGLSRRVMLRRMARYAVGLTIAAEAPGLVTPAAAQVGRPACEAWYAACQVCAYTYLAECCLVCACAIPKCLAGCSVLWSSITACCSYCYTQCGNLGCGDCGPCNVASAGCWGCVGAASLDVDFEARDLIELNRPVRSFVDAVRSYSDRITPKEQEALRVAFPYVWDGPDAHVHRDPAIVQRAMYRFALDMAKSGELERLRAAFVGSVDESGTFALNAPGGRVIRLQCAPLADLKGHRIR